MNRQQFPSFAQTLEWLRYRNRLHAPTTLRTRVGGQERPGPYLRTQTGRARPPLPPPVGPQPPRSLLQSDTGSAILDLAPELDLTPSEPGTTAGGRPFAQADDHGLDSDPVWQHQSPPCNHWQQQQQRARSLSHQHDDDGQQLQEGQHEQHLPGLSAKVRPGVPPPVANGHYPGSSKAVAPQPQLNGHATQPGRLNTGVWRDRSVSGTSLPPQSLEQQRGQQQLERQQQAHLEDVDLPQRGDTKLEAKRAPVGFPPAGFVGGGPRDTVTLMGPPRLTRGSRHTSHVAHNNSLPNGVGGDVAGDGGGAPGRVNGQRIAAASGLADDGVSGAAAAADGASHAAEDICRDARGHAVRVDLPLHPSLLLLRSQEPQTHTTMLRAAPPVGTQRWPSSALSGAIREAASLDELADLYDAAYDSFRSGHVSAALSRLPHARELSNDSKPELYDPRHVALLDSLLEQFERHRTAGLYGTRELSACAWVLGKLGRRERRGLVADLAAHVLLLRRRHEILQQQQRPELHAQPQRQPREQQDQKGAQSKKRGSRTSGAGPAKPGQAHMPTTTSAPARRDVSPTALAAELLAVAPGQPGPCSQIDIANMALGMAKVGVTRPQLWQGLVEAARPQLSAFRTQELTNLAWALAQAHRAFWRQMQDSAAGGHGGGAEPHAHADSQPCDSGRPGLEQDAAAASTDAGISLEGFLRVINGQLKGSQGRDGHKRHAAADVWQPWLGAFVEGDLAPRAQVMLHQCTGQQTANMAWALATLGHQKPQTLEVVTAEAMERARVLVPQSLCNLLWAMATMSERIQAEEERRRSRMANLAHASRVFGRAAGASGTNSSTGGGVSISGSSEKEEVSEPQDGGPGEPKPPQGQDQARAPLVEAGVVARQPLHCLAMAAGRRIREFTPQGLSNLLWSLSSLRSRSIRSLLHLAAREAMRQLPEMRPLALATLLESWASAGLYHPRLFAAVAPAALSQIRSFRPSTLVRLLAAYGATGHCDRRLFLTAAALLLLPMQRESARSVSSQPSSGSDGTQAGGDKASPAGQPSPAVLLDDLSYGELYDLLVSYGQVGVHAPRLFDEVLVRMRQMSAGRRVLHPRPAARLASLLATLGHQPPLASTAAAAAAAKAAVAYVHKIRNSILPAVLDYEPSLAIAGVWALMRLGVTGPAVVVRLADVLSRRTGSEGANRTEALRHVVYSLAGNQLSLSRLAQVLGLGATAALAEAAGAAAAAAVPVADTSIAPGHGEANVLNGANGGKAAVRAAAAAAAGHLLASGLVVVVDQAAAELHLELMDGALLAGLATGLAGVLGRLAAPGQAAVVAACGGDTARWRALYGRMYDLLAGVVGQALRRTALLSSGSARGASAVAGAQGRVARLAPRDMAAVLHAFCDSGLSVTQPAMRSRAAQILLHVLVRTSARASGVPAVRLQSSGVTHPMGTRPSSQLPGPTQIGMQRGLDRLQHQRRPPQAATAVAVPSRRARAPVGTAPEDLASLLAVAARLGLYEQPVARPVIAALVAHLAQAGARCSPAALQEVLRHCRPASVEGGRRLPAGVGAEAGGDGRVEQNVGRDGGLRREVYGWAARLALQVLPWLPAPLQQQVMEDTQQLRSEQAMAAAMGAAPEVRTAEVSPAVEPGCGARRAEGPATSRGVQPGLGSVAGGEAGAAEGAGAGGGADVAGGREARTRAEELERMPGLVSEPTLSHLRGANGTVATAEADEGVRVDLRAPRSGVTIVTTCLATPAPFNAAVAAAPGFAPAAVVRPGSVEATGREVGVVSRAGRASQPGSCRVVATRSAAGPVIVDGDAPQEVGVWVGHEGGSVPARVGRMWKSGMNGYVIGRVAAPV